MLLAEIIGRQLKHLAMKIDSVDMIGRNGGGICTNTENFNSPSQPCPRTGSKIVKDMVEETIAQKLDVKSLITSTSNTFRLADLGCSVGPNTFYCVQNILEAVKQKFRSQSSDGKLQKLVFQVFFNDLVTNDFNTLFLSLPFEREYLAAGTPGSFFGQLFPDSSIHFVHCSYALQWLSQVPPKLLNEDSSAWNKGRIFYINAPQKVVKAYTEQFAKDLEMFLDARAKEIVEGGLMVLILPSNSDGVTHSNMPLAKLFDHLGSCLLDMAKEGIIEEVQLDSFNIPMYVATPTEMVEIIERNGCFDIERVESKRPTSNSNYRSNGPLIKMHFRAGMAAVISQHFGEEIMDDLFDRFLENIDELISSLESTKAEGNQLTVFLKRKSICTG